jgi:arsenite methyltransferase
MSSERIDPTDREAVHAVVRDKYAAIARESASCCAPTCCGPQDVATAADTVLEKVGYTSEQAASIPEGANLGLGCGNPLAHAALAPGEVVLDLGSGAGIDVFLAAREVGPSGRVIGVDMTPAMLDRARANAAKTGSANVEFRLGEIEHLPLPDASVDVVISNCVINLSPDKEQVFREALRVLRPGGRLLVSDLVLTRPLPDAVRHSVAAYVGCVAGASLEPEYLAQVSHAGFVDVDVVQRDPYTVGDETSDPVYRDGLRAVVSVKVRARKRA